MRSIFTSESVTEGHPDKLADQVSDSVLDAVLANDPTGRVACEVLVTTGICVVAGEITTTTYVDVPKVAREVIEDIGYTNAAFGYDCKTCGVLNTIQSQSPEATGNVLPATIVRQVFLGASRDYTVALADNTELRVTAPPAQDMAPGQKVWLGLPAERCRALAGGL